LAIKQLTFINNLPHIATSLRCVQIKIATTGRSPHHSNSLNLTFLSMPVMVCPLSAVFKKSCSAGDMDVHSRGESATISIHITIQTMPNAPKTQQQKI
jgi:hypothetical protein